MTKKILALVAALGALTLAGAVEVIGRRLEHPPTLDIEPINEGFAPTGVSC
jgi:hypothetical protein